MAKFTGVRHYHLIYVSALHTNALLKKVSNCTDEVNRKCFLANYAKGGDSRNFSSADDSQYMVYTYVRIYEILSTHSYVHVSPLLDVQNVLLRSLPIQVKLHSCKNRAIILCTHICMYVCMYVCC